MRNFLLTQLRVIFTLTDHLGQVFGQQVTRPIMITDDHKDKDKKDSAPPSPPTSAENTQLPGHFTFQSGPPAPQCSAGLQQSFSTPNLTAMAQGYGYMQPETMRNTRPFHTFQPNVTSSNNEMSHATSGTLTPQARSRQASPTGTSGPQSKKRKSSGSGRILEQLRMTPMDAAQSSNPGLQGAATVHRTQAPPNRLNRLSHPTGIVGYRTDPPSPSTTGFRSFSDANRSQSMDNFVDPTFSVPASAHASRHSSPPSAIQGNAMGFQQELTQALDFSLQNAQPTSHFGQQRPNSQTIPQLPMQQFPSQGVPNFQPSDPSSPRVKQFPTQGVPNFQPPGPTSPPIQHFPGQGVPNYQPTALSSPRVKQFPTQGVPNFQPPAPPPPPRLRVEEMVPDSGPVGGDTLCVFIGAGFYDELQVFFGNRRVTGVRTRSGLTLSCRSPPGDGPGKVPIRFVHVHAQGLPPTEPDRPLHFEYTGNPNKSPDPDRAQTVPIQDEKPSTDQMGNYGNGMQQWSAGNAAGPYQQQYQHQHQQQQYGFQHQMYTAESGPGYHGRRPGFAETPPSYHDVLAEDDQRILDMKTKSTLRAVGDALMDEKSQEMFDPTTTQTSTFRAASSTEKSHRMERVTIGRGPMSDEQMAKLRAERREKVKGLSSDRKLWAVWVSFFPAVSICTRVDHEWQLTLGCVKQLPILILVMIAMTYDRLPLVWSIICALLGYIKKALLPSINKAAQRSVLYIHDRLVGLERILEVG